MKVYVLTMYAVYDHGCAGVFTSQEAATSHAEALIDRSDWHHSFAIEEIEVDHPLVTEPLTTSYDPPGHKARGTRPEVRFSPWEKLIAERSSSVDAASSSAGSDEGL